MKYKCFFFYVPLFVTVLSVVNGQEYDLSASLRIDGGSRWYNDTFAEIYYLDGLDRFIPFFRLQGNASHRIGYTDGDFILKHGIDVTTVSGTDELSVDEIEVTNHLYEGYLSFSPTPWTDLSIGRHRLDWGTGTNFSATDAIHPQFDYLDGGTSSEDIGFDGFSLSLLPGPDLTVSLAAAFQEALTEADFREVRTAAYMTGYLSVLEIGAAVVYQWEEILRPGILVSSSVGPFLLSGEAAVELYGEEAVINPRLLINAGVEYALHKERVDLILSGEYLANGLADPALPDSGRTRLNDNAGSFAMNDLQYAAVDFHLNVKNRWNTANRFLVNLTDGSALMNHEFVLTTFPGIDFGAGVNWTGGDGGTEFGIGSYDNPYHVIGTLWAEVHL